MRTITALLSLALLLTLPACQAPTGPKPFPGSTTEARTQNALQSLSGEWTLTEIAGSSIEPLTPHLTRGMPSLEITPDARVAGLAAINRYTAKLEAEPLANGIFQLGPIAATRALGPPIAMDLEQRVLRALEATSNIRYTRNTLTLERDQTPLLKFSRTNTQ